MQPKALRFTVVYRATQRNESCTVSIAFITSVFTGSGLLSPEMITTDCQSLYLHPGKFSQLYVAP